MRHILLIIYVWTLFIAGCSDTEVTRSQNASSKNTHPEKASPEVTHNENALPSLEWGFAYDDAGHLIKVSNPGGKHTTLSYKLDDKQHLRQLTKKLADGSHVSYKFDRFGRRVSMTDTFGTVRYEYDGFNRLTAVHCKGSPTISYTYDTQDRLNSVSLGKGLTTHYTYDFLGRLASMDTPAGVISYEYQNSQGKIIRTLPNGIFTVWQYAPNGSLESITHAGKDRLILAKFTYANRPDGLIKAIQEWTPQGEKVLNYEYDTVQRLIAVTDSHEGKTEYRYDKFGNRIELGVPGKPPVTSSYDWAGKLISHNGQDCQHDAASNLMTCGGDAVFEYNGENLLKTVSNNIHYQYDGDGYLTARMVDDDKTTFISHPLTDIWKPLLAKEKNGDTFYIWEGNLPLATIKNGQVNFFLHDHLGSVRHIADRRGKITQRLNYSPFGVPQHKFNKKHLQPSFAGLFVEPTTSIYLTHGRVYKADLGRFLQIDPQHRVPMGSQEDFSLFAYCGGDPVNFTDRNGLSRESVNPDFLNYINGVTEPHYENSLSLGVGSGTQSLETIANSAAGSFDVVFVWGSKEGIPMDFLRATFLDQSGLARTGPRILPFEVTEISVHHSAGNNFLVSGAKRTIRLDPQNYLLSHDDIYETGIVSNLTGVDLKTPLSKGLFGISFTGQFDGLNIFKGIKEATGDMARLGKGLVQLGSRTLSWPFTGKGPFQTHALNPMLDKAELKGDIPSKGTYNKTTVYYIDDQGKVSDTKIIDYQKMFNHNKDPRHRRFRNGNENVFDFGCPGCDDGGGPSGPSGPGGGISPMSPTNVGGIYLSGASEALKNLGPLTGIAIDQENGRLVLLSEKQGMIDLPPLRMDDVVTIFRSVYEHGDAPYVSIDPNQRDPQGPIMLVRHGEATKNTYVGWVLFEADRVMKAYSLGYDNITQKKLESQVAGYQSLFDLGASGFSGRQKPIWERFWIVPAEVNRHQNQNGQLTLLDVPLKVNTQRMVLRKGKLVPAPNPSPSKAAEGFSRWFTQHYDEIAQEALTQPPMESGINAQVAFFSELRRIALITAIAETLRDQGVPLPSWMRTYQIKPVPVSPTTPSITVETSKTETKGRRTITRTQRIFGGVNLAPADNAVHTIASAPQAEALAPAVARAITATPLLSPVSFEKDGKRYQAVALPGNNTRDVGAVRLEPTDLVVPVQRGTQIALTRKFNSFFQPSDVFGGTWTLDLPQLKQQRRPIQRTEDEVKYQITYQLTSPLNTWSDNSVGLARDNDKRIGYPTKSLFRDKRRWHFNKQGHLVAWAETPLLVVYRRDQAQRLRRIEGWYGKSLRADIKFKYDASGRLLSAHGSNDEVVNYKYDERGMLKAVESPQGNLEYAYKNGLITAITQYGKTREFYYNARGQLQKERLPDGTTVAYTTSSGSQGTKVTTTRAGKVVESVQYNAAFQPTQRTFDDGSQIVWRQNGTGAVETTLTSSEGEQYVVTTDGNKQTTWQFPQAGTYTAEYADGHLTMLKQGDRPILRQDWLKDGRLVSAISETTALHPEYRDDDVLTSVLVTPPGKGPFNRWVKFQYDEQGRASAIKDYSGSEIAMAYDKNGELSALASNRGSAQIKRDDQGKVVAVQSSWGYAQTNIYDHGKIKAIRFSQGNDTASIEFNQERPTLIRQFDGAKWGFSYHNQGVKEIHTPNDVVLSYEYDADNRLVAVHFDKAYSIKYSYDLQGRLVKLMRVSQ